MFMQLVYIDLCSRYIKAYGIMQWIIAYGIMRAYGIMQWIIAYGIMRAYGIMQSWTQEMDI